MNFPNNSVVLRPPNPPPSLFQPGIELYEDGRLHSATLTEDLLLESQYHHAGERIHLTPEGKAQKD